MRRSTHWMIAITYYSSLLSGILSFHWDQYTGDIYTSNFITAYSAVVSLAMFGIVPYLLRLNFQSPKLYENINSCIVLIRIITLLITVTFNWSKRRNFMQTLKKFQCLHKNFRRRWPLSEKLKQKFEDSVRSKFCWGFLANTFLIVGSYEFFKYQYNVEDISLTLFLCVLCNIINLVMSNYYFCLTHLNILLAGMNEELRDMLIKCHNLANLQSLNEIRPAALIMQCCTISDNLDDLAWFQHGFYKLANCMHDMYAVQGLCVLLTLYLNNLVVIYSAYTSTIHEYLKNMYGQWTLVIMSLVLFLYYVDLKMFLYCIFEQEDLFEKTASLLREYQPCMPNLDVRLENSVSNVLQAYT